MTTAFSAALTLITLLLFIAVVGDHLADDAEHHKDPNYAHNKSLDKAKRIYR